MISNRKNAIIMWVVCALVAPMLLFMQLLQAVFGSPERSLRMAVALDACGNALFGGDQLETVSARTGKAVIDGKRWAKTLAPIIDHFFGTNHCTSEYLKVLLARKNNIRLELQQ